MFAASLLSSPSTVRLVSPVPAKLKPSVELCTTGFGVPSGFFNGQATGAAGVPISNTAFSRVTQAPAVNAWPAGDEGCEGDPPLSICGHCQLSAAVSPPFVFPSSLRLTSITTTPDP